MVGARPRASRRQAVIAEKGIYPMLARELTIARCQHALPNCSGSLAIGVWREQHLACHGWHLDMHVNAIQQRPGKSGTIGAHTIRRAVAAAGTYDTVKLIKEQGLDAARSSPESASSPTNSYSASR